MSKIQKTAGLLIIIFAGILFLSAGCSVKKPESPTWETTWDLPLASTTYSIQDILDEIDSEEITYDTLGNPIILINHEIDTIAVENNLPALDDVNQSFFKTVGVIEIEAPAVEAVSVALSEIVNPDYISFGYIPLDTSFTINRTLASFTTFSSAVLSQGLLQIEVVDSVGIDIDLLAIALFNADDLTDTLGTAIYGSISNGTTVYDTIDLAGKEIRNQLAIVAFGMVDSQGFTNPQEYLKINGAFIGALTVTSALAEVSDSTYININEQAEITNNDGSTIHEAELSSGTLSLQVANGSGVPVILDISLPNIENQAGSPLTIQTTVNAGSNGTIYENLSGYTIKPDTTASPQSFSITGVATIPPSGPGNMYDINSTDSIQITADITNIALASVTGIIAPTSIDIELDPQELDIPQGFENARLTQAELRIKLYNYSTAMVYVDLQLISDVPGIDPVSITDTIQARSFQSSVPEETQLTVGSTTLSDFLNPPPAYLTIEGSAVFNPDSDLVTITTSDYFYGEVEIYSPLAFALNDTAEIEIDPGDIDVGSEDLPDFEETFVYGNIRAEIASRLPVGAGVSLYLSARDYSIFDDPEAVVIGPFTLNAANTDINGYAIDTVVSIFEDSLTSSEISIFDNEIVYIAPRIQLLPTTANGSVIQSSDYITIRATARLKVRAGEHLFEDDDDN